MVIGIKDATKLIGISIIACCAVFVCTLFLNFYFDIQLIELNQLSEQAKIFYDAQVSVAQVICLVSGGCLLITSVVMLMFYIKHYIDTHKKELGILKALGYSNLKIAKNFWVFGISVLVGAILGFGGAFLMMPRFYEMQNEEKILPEIFIGFHFEILLYFVILPTLAFALLAIFYAFIKLKKPVLTLLKEVMETSSKVKKQKASKSNDLSFLVELKRNTLKRKKTLLFFVIFASFCFSAMTQMSVAVTDLSSKEMSAIILIIGITLACVTLFIAITTIVKGNTKTIAMMRVLGYSQKECCQSILGGYRILAYIGFAIGTVYQYALIRMVIEVAFKDMEGVTAPKFDVSVMLVSLLAFVVVYETVMFVYSEKIKKLSVKEIMI